MKGNVQGVWTQREVEAVGERPREPQSDSFGIAAVTTGRDFRATTRRVPRRLRPFNRGVIGRHAPENTRVGSKKVLPPRGDLRPHGRHESALRRELVGTSSTVSLMAISKRTHGSCSKSCTRRCATNLPYVMFSAPPSDYASEERSSEHGSAF